MACNCGKNKQGVVKYTIQGDPEGRRYLTEKEAKDARTARDLAGAVVPVTQ
jgi:hypothetical protein